MDAHFLNFSNVFIKKQSIIFVELNDFHSEFDLEDDSFYYVILKIIIFIFLLYLLQLFLIKI